MNEENRARRLRADRNWLRAWAILAAVHVSGLVIVTGVALGAVMVRICP